MATFLGELEARSWTYAAPCIDHPDLNWTCGPSRGIESAATVVACLEVCASCPVRPECLDAAISDRAHTMMGVWGGTTMTERTHALALARPLVGSEAEASRLATDMLEATFGARLEMWTARTQGRTPMALIVTETIPSCDRCGQGFLWEGALCSKLCRRIAKRILVSAHREREIA